MRKTTLASLLLLTAACGSTPPAANTPTTPSAPETANPVRDPSLYQKEYPWPADWTDAADEDGKPVHGAKLAKQEGDRRLVVVDSASALFGHNEKLKRTVVVLGSHCGMNVSQAVVANNPLGVIGHDAGIGLHSAGIVCISLGDANGIPAATVSADSAYIGVAMSVWTTGKISVVNEAAKVLGVQIGMTTQEAADIMMKKATPRS